MKASDFGNFFLRHYVVMISDTEGDKQTAKAAGVQFLGVNYGFDF